MAFATLLIAAVLPAPPAAGTHPTCFGLEPTLSTAAGQVRRGGAQLGVIVGTNGDDVLVGTPGDDLLMGLGGNDYICGLAGNDMVVAGGGSDRVDGGEGADTLHGTDGDDRITGGAGDDELLGDTGNDFLWGQEGGDHTNGGPDTDTCESEVEVLCEAARRSQLLVGETFAVPSTNPAVSTAGSVHAYWEIMYNGLIALDEGGNPIPELATRVPTVANGDIIDNGATYTLRLRDDVFWHDDDPQGVRRQFTAVDVKFTFEKALLIHHARTRNMAPALASWDPVNQVASIDVVDPFTVRFRFAQPYAPLLKQLNVTEAPMIPAHLYTGNPSLATLNGNKVGTGPMKFASSSAVEAKVVRNPNYFRAPLPYLDEIVMRPIIDDAARKDALLTRQVDYIWDIPDQFVAGVQANPDFRTAATQSLGGGPNSMDQLLLNLTKPGDRRGQIGGPDPTGTPDPHPILGDLRVRKAIFHAIDRQGFLTQGRSGIGQVATAPISSELPFHATDTTLPAFDLAAARALLDQAGWKDEGGAFRVGRSVPNHPELEGQPLVLRFFCPSAIFVNRAAFLDAALAAVGIDLQVTCPNPSATNQVFVLRDFDTSILNYAQGYDPHVGVRRQYHSDQVSTIGTPNNGPGYKNPLVDAAFDQAVTIIDFAQRFGHYHDFQAKVAQDLPYVWLIETPNVRGYTAKCTDFKVFTGLFAEDAHCAQ